MPSSPDVSNETANDFERVSRAVLAADVVGYTRLMEADELEVHRRYRRLRVEVIDPYIVSARGEVVKNTGDGFLAIFECPVDALDSADELQREIMLREAKQPPERRITFRIGIHWEPVIFDLNDVYGSGVNIAARLQTVAPAGGIVLSSAMLEQIGDVREYEFDSLGELRLKNLTRSIAAFSLRLPGVDRSAAVGFSGKGSKQAKLPSVAILPFVSLSPQQPDQEQTQSSPMGQDEEGTTGQGGMMHEGMAGRGMMGGGMMRGGVMGRGMMAGGHAMGACSPIMFRMIFALMDSDGDGTISLQEFQAAHERIFKVMDSNKDGQLTEDEMLAFMHGTTTASRPPR